jgi:S1-C subfamily serine protease
MRINVERAAGSSGPIRHEEVRRQLAAVIPRGYVGFDAQGPVVRTLRESGEFARYLAFPAVVGVEPNSPADRAGISRGDTLLAYNGRDVRTELNLTEMFAPDRRLAVTVRRDGSTKDFTVVVAEASPMIMERRLSSLLEPSLPAQFVVTTRGGGAGMAAAGAGGLSPSVRPSRAEGVSVVGPRRVAPLMMATGVWGAELLALKPELAKVFGASRGVLVVDVPPGSPGHRMGLRVSDVIVKLNGVDVVSIDDLRVRLARMQEKTAELEILRDKKTRTISIETGR